MDTLHDYSDWMHWPEDVLSEAAPMSRTAAEQSSSLLHQQQPEGYDVSHWPAELMGWEKQPSLLDASTLPDGNVGEIFGMNGEQSRSPGPSAAGFSHHSTSTLAQSGLRTPPVSLPLDLDIPPNQEESLFRESPAPSSPTAQPSSNPYSRRPRDTDFLLHKYPSTSNVSPAVSHPAPPAPNSVLPTLVLTSSRPRNVQYGHSRDDIDRILSEATAPTTACPYCGKRITGAGLERHLQTHAAGQRQDEIYCIGVPPESQPSDGVKRQQYLHPMTGEIFVGGCGTGFSRRDAYLRHFRKATCLPGADAWRRRIGGGEPD
ncbi:uncharacterized protein B0H18DRAFT_1103242 [Fomitopsis serialis]|uniref:uncharacterized protein n=1 Tax=Fomitopsis serialis TaxID=139415 RepID=UPI002007E2A2|nr:uncharacterized protein B0H18DRAFT_1103242 [Neoantrodia serialis]KAH9930087.1 hypothetical protein B0H18DRAFT_1103242 [Neoantrodia serialis]